MVHHVLQCELIPIKTIAFFFYKNTNMSCKSNSSHWLNIYQDTQRHSSTQKTASLQKLTFSLYTIHEKSALSGLASQERDTQLSLEVRIDAVAILAWMSDGTDILTGAIAKVSNSSIVSKLVIQKIWLRMKVGDPKIWE